jgi:hypothetical protein
MRTVVRIFLWRSNTERATIVASNNAENPMDDLTYVILQSAVTVAKEQQIRTLPALRTRLALMYPNAPEQCEAALTAWGEYVRKAHPNGVSRHEA